MELNRNKKSPSFKIFVLNVGFFPSLVFDYIVWYTVLCGKFSELEAQSLTARLPAQGSLQAWNASTQELPKPGQPLKIAIWALCAACAW